MRRIVFSQSSMADEQLSPGPKGPLGRRLTNICKTNMNRFLTKKKAKRAQPEPKFELDLSTALPSSNDFRTSLLMPGLSSRFSMLREQDDPNSILGKASDDSVLEPKRQSRLYDYGFKPTGLSDIAEVSSISSSVRPPFAQERTASYASDNDYGTDGDTEGGSMMNRARQGEGNVLFGGRQKITRIGGDGSKGRTLYDDDVAKSTFQKWRAEERQREREAAANGTAKFSFEEERKSPTKPGSYAPSVAGSLKRQTSSSTATSGMDSRSSTAATSINSQGPPSASMSPAAGFSAFNFGPSVTNAANSTSTVPEQERVQQAAPQPASAPVPAPMQSATPMIKKRLYDQGLNRELQDQQSNAMSRLHSINKRPGMNGRTTPDVFQPRNGYPSADRPMNNGMNGRMPSNRAPGPGLERKPTLTGLPGRNVKIDPSNPDQISPLPRSPLPPVSPNPAMQNDRQEVLASAVNPNDRGKATAMGVFNKPKQFNEQQFLDRQMALRQGRDTPTPRDNVVETIPESPKEPQAVPEEPVIVPPPTEHSAEVRGAPSAPIPTSAPSPRPNLSPVGQAPPVGRPGPSPWERSRSVSNGPFNRARSTSTTERTESPTAPTPFSAFQKAANQLKGNPAPAPIPEERHDTPQMSSRARFNFIDDSDSDYEEEGPAPSVQPLLNGKLPPNARLAGDAPTVAPPTHEHPMFRNSPQPSRENLRVDVRKPSIEHDIPIENRPVPGDVDSPTLPAATGNGLSGMIRHLRDNSATSNYSVMTAAPTPLNGPTVQTRNLPNGQTSAGAMTTAHSSYSHSNPWDLEEFNSEMKNVEGRDSVSVLESEGSKDRAAEVPPLKQAATQKQEPAQESSWQQELNKKTHARGGSTETQQEREALASELAARQKAIQEKMRERAERDMRSASPGPKPAAPFMGMLRQKSSFDNFRSRENSRTRDESRPRGQSRPRGESTARGADKAARILGVNASSASLPSHDRPSHDAERGPVPRSAPMPMPRPSREMQQPGYGPPNGAATGSRPSTGRESSEEKVRSRSNSNAPVPVTGRSRSNSELSGGRSRSRQGRYRDDAGPGAEATIPEHLPPQSSPPEQAIPEVPESPNQANGLREYKPIDAANFQQQGLWPPPQNPIVHPLGVPSPRPSPGLSPSPAFGGPMSPALQVPVRPSPGPSPGLSPGLGQMSPGIFNSGRATPISPFANPTPPLSSSSTPTASAFPGSASTPNLLANAGLKAARSRKMSIKKTDIGDPVLISTTSVVDTVDLPAGASLRNGMEAPPVPPINPRRKRFAFGRADTEPPQPPFANPMYGSGSHSSDESPKPPRTRHRLKKSSSDGAKIGLYIRAQQESKFPPATQSTPALAQLQSSPPRMQNGMF